jgi:phospholipid/cholesterol/gamma-HCH transport system permease protein
MKGVNINSSILTPYLAGLGRYALLLVATVRGIWKRGLIFEEVTEQVLKIGFHSLPIVLLTALFTGMVLALQTAYGLERFGAKNYVGNITGLGFLRELGPVLTAIVVCGRVGAGVSAEIASMVVTEQVDALRALGADPFQKLVAPRIIASMIVTPILVVFADIVGIYGGLLVAVYELDISAHLYQSSLLSTVLMRDFTDGLLKSVVFGLLVVSIACFKGLSVRGGTEGVGRTTTSSVVTGSIVLFIADFFLTKLLMLL